MHRNSSRKCNLLEDFVTSKVCGNLWFHDLTFLPVCPGDTWTALSFIIQLPQVRLWLYFTRQQLISIHIFLRRSLFWIFTMLDRKSILFWPDSLFVFNTKIHPCPKWQQTNCHNGDEQNIAIMVAYLLT